MSGVPPAEGDFTFRKRDQAMVGDGHAMGVAAQILEHIFGTTEGRFRVDHPVLSEQQAQPGSKGFALGERCQSSREVQSAVLERLLEPRDELSTKDSREHLKGKKEAVL